MSDYWKKRQEEKLFDVLDDADVSVEYIADIYYKASIHLNEQIQGVFDTYRAKNGISIQEAKILLNSLNNPNDYDELLRKLKSNPSGDERKEIIKKLDAPAYRYRIKRLQDSQDEMDALMKNIYNVEKETSTLHYINAAYDSYYKDIYNIQRDTGIAFDFNELDPSFVDSMLKSRWSGENYSDRIWNNTTELASQLKEEMMMGLLTNKTEKMMQQTIIDKFMVGAYQARRLIETESAAMVSMTDQLAFEEAGVDTEIFRAVHDFKTSKICQRMDGTVVKRKNIEIGKNAPPMHPHCRSIMEPVIGDGIKYKRRQRNHITGKDEIVDTDETYDQWLKRMQNNHGIDTVETFQKKTKNLSSDRRQYRLYKDVLGSEFVPESLDKFQDMKYNDIDKFNELKLSFIDGKLQKEIIKSYNLSLREGQQGKHILDHNNYTDSRSYIVGASMEDIQKCILTHAGKGTINRDRSGKWNNTETIVDDTIVGYVLNIDKTWIATNKFKIHYSKEKGTHMVPTLKGVKKND